MAIIVVDYNGVAYTAGVLEFGDGIPVEDLGDGVIRIGGMSGFTTKTPPAAPTTTTPSCPLCDEGPCLVCDEGPCSYCDEGPCTNCDEGFCNICDESDCIFFDIPHATTTTHHPTTTTHHPTTTTHHPGSTTTTTEGPTTTTDSPGCPTTAFCASDCEAYYHMAVPTLDCPPPAGKGCTGGNWNYVKATGANCVWLGGQLIDGIPAAKRWTVGSLACSNGMWIFYLTCNACGASAAYDRSATQHSCPNGSYSKRAGGDPRMPGGMTVLPGWV
jgi:hypothetical protein